MASSSTGDQDTSSITSNDKQSNPNNPFVQFRHFADAQISTLLQGIVGLPSALSQRSPDDGRWIGFDDSLRRRDELQERQRELKESEARKNRQVTEGGELYAQNGKRISGEYVALGNRIEEKEPLSKDLPLYSAVTKSLFTHLQGQKLDEDDWDELKDPHLWLGKTPVSSRLPLDVQSFQLTHPGQIDIEVTQRLIYKDLLTDRRLHSEYSLLPYLLFSPYSPLKLSSAQMDELPYSEAFEDLIAMSHPVSKDSYWKQVVSTMIGSRIDSHRAHVHWIEKLRALGYLQERETRLLHETDCSAISLPLMVLNGIQQFEDAIKTMTLPESPEECFTTQSSSATPPPEDPESQMKDVANAKTEQEMYDQFLNWISSSQIIKDSVQAADALVASIENDGMSGRRREEEDDNRRPRSIMEEVLAITKGFRDMAQTQDAPPKAMQSDQPSEVVQPEPLDRVVSSSTTTEQTVCEDGTVLTSVTVWKKFGSGRETTSTTDHCENPAVAANTESTEEQGSNSPGLEKDTDENITKKKNGSSGWFWN
ncbi:uncharacterized protein RCO7_08991 [Rhynchosporium graminicola]|uniref:Uncharacterized protein n=1 Tax=Rhynchosporium graminicola TaxID=2792576 RepID=A0A1E1JUU4_9HELO|nr:uncharacterized protein RCO7_08991 [Rhynchosporium commune]